MNSISAEADRHWVEQSPSQAVEISVTVQTYNRSPYLLKCLLSLLSQDLDNGRTKFEIIVTDNNSTDDTQDVVNRIQKMSNNIPVYYLFEARQGLSHARNKSVEYAHGKYVAFLDDDGVAEPDWLIRLWQTIQSDSRIVCVGGRTVPEWETECPQWLDSRFSLYVGFQGEEASSATRLNEKYVGGGNAIYLRKAILSAGGFPVGLGRKGNSLLSGEEEDLQTRLRKAGGDVFYEPKAIMHHSIPEYRMRLDYMCQRGFGVGQSLCIIRLKNNGLLKTAFYQIGYVLNLILLAFSVWIGNKSLTGRESKINYLHCRKAFVRGYFKQMLAGIISKLFPSK